MAQIGREDPGTFRRIYETNVFGTVAVTNAFLPALRRSASWHPARPGDREARAG
jgi:NAD(P)-dependent dehydrogenase (short-subunit alcohol dehydrogenase family)